LAGARLASARNQTHERQTEDIIGALMSGDHDKVEPGQVQLGTGLEPAGKRSNGMAIDKIDKKERRDNEIVRICWL
jgi:hypothetical protein